MKNLTIEKKSESDFLFAFFFSILFFFSGNTGNLTLKIFFFLHDMSNFTYYILRCGGAWIDKLFTIIFKYYISYGFEM